MKTKVRLYGELFLVSATLGVALAALAYAMTRSSALAAVSALAPVAFSIGGACAVEYFDGR